MKKSLQIIILIIFALSLSLPLAEMFLRLDPTPPRMENRKLTEKPGPYLSYHSFNRYMQAVRAYVDDRFGFRNFFIFGYGWIRYRVFHVSPSADVVLGNDGWLFLAKQNDIELHRGVFPYTPEELKTFLTRLRERFAWSKEKGISYVFTVGPDSHTLNPEHLPPWAQKNIGTSRIDQLLEGNSKDPLPMVDLRPALWSAKKSHMVSYKTDTHWNAYGGYIAYRTLLERLHTLNPKVGAPLVTENDLHFETIDRKGMDLTILTGLQNVIREQSEEPLYTGKMQFETTEQEGLHFTTINPQGQDLTVICLCDSMAGNLFPYLARQFKTVRVMWGYDFNVDEIKKYHPDLIIEMVIERELAWSQSENAPEVRAALAKKSSSSP